MRQPPHAATPLLGESQVIATLRGQVLAAADSDAKVLILGETGTGKEIVARMIHDHGHRRERAFVAVNCSGIPETLLESELFGHTRGSFTGAYRDKEGLVRRAHRGTLVLDELGEMSLRMQAVLLRFTETGEVQELGADGPTARADVRLITATSRDLGQHMASGAFREDLYYRLNVIQLNVAPLRERGGDVLLLARYYLEQSARAHRRPVPELSADVERAFETYAWPGNVRELRNIAERLVLLEHSGALTPDHLPVEIRPAVRASVAPPGAGEPQSEPAAALAPIVSPAADELWERMRRGEDFWTVVAAAFRARELTRKDLMAIVDRGLRETRGSYRGMLKIVNLPPTEYKRLHACLYQHRCNLPVGPYRNAPARQVRGMRNEPAPDAHEARRSTRRWPRTAMKAAVPVSVDELPAHLLEASDGGARLELNRPAGGSLPEALTLRLPASAVPMQANVAWMQRKSGNTWICGVAIEHGAGDQWRTFVESIAS
jgi:DNA-binding NtrC family response regulator